MKFGNSAAIGYRTMEDRPALWNPYADDWLEEDVDDEDDAVDDADDWLEADVGFTTSEDFDNPDGPIEELCPPF